MSIPSSMRAARLVAVGKPVEIHDIPVPTPQPGEVLVKIAACGVCLSDVHLLDGSLPAFLTPPVTLGHEASGSIVALGEGVKTRTIGERVTLFAGKPCGVCPPCRTGGGVEECRNVKGLGIAYDGGWAEYATVPATMCATLPEAVPFDVGAILADAVGTPYAAVTEAGGVRPGERVAIFGIGGLGTHAVQIARLSGASFIAAIDPRQSARDRALAVGADVALQPDGAVAAIRTATGGEGVDAAFDFVGVNDVLKAAVASLGYRGRAVMAGVGGERIALGPSIMFVSRQNRLVGTFGYRMRHLEELIALVQSGRLDLSGSISARMPLEDAAEAVDMLATKRGDPVRLLLVP